MEDYRRYGFSDFLADPDFRKWVRNGRSDTHPVWPKIAAFFPEKAESMRQAADLTAQLFDRDSRISAEEFEHEVNRIMESSARREVQRSVPFMRWYWVAASLFLGMAMWWLLKPETESVPAAYHALKEAGTLDVRHIHNTSDTAMSVRLPDGSLARLHPGAELKYGQARFDHKSQTDPKREVYMRGDIFFDVAHDTSWPFIVYTDGFITRVVGTSFMIRASGDQSSVEVKSGKVIVRPLLGGERDTIALTPNHMATYTSTANHVKKELSSDPVVLAARGTLPDFNFANTPISEVFETLEAAYGISVRFDTASYKDCSLSVRMAEEPFYEKLDIVCKTIGADYFVSDGEVVIIGQGCQ